MKHVPLEGGVARCGFDIDIPAYADIDIKIPLAGESAPLLPWTPPAKSRVWARLPRPEPQP